MLSDQFQWDKGNIKKSLVKHKISPLEAMSVFLNNKRLLKESNKLIYNEFRYLRVAYSAANRLLTVVYTYRNGKIRIISTRKANKSETKAYLKKYPG